MSRKLQLLSVIGIALAGLVTASPAFALWQSRTAMSTARGSLGLARSGSFLYAFGGNNNGVGLQSAEGYSPQINAWGAIAAPPVGRTAFGAATGPNGKVYLVGGCSNVNTGCNASAITRVDAYNPATNSYSTIAPLPVARVANGAARGGDGRLYAVAGRNTSGSLARVDAYSFSTGHWSQVASLPHPRYGAVVVTGQDGKIYVLGGVGGPNTWSNANDVYNPSTNSWVSRRPLPVGVAYASGAVGPDGRIYVVGGCNSTVVPTDCLYTGVQVYNPQSNRWSQANALFDGVDSAAARVASDGFLYLVGGYYDQISGDAVEPFTQRLDVAKPTAPRTLSGSFNSGSGTVDLSWGAASDNNAVGGYEVFRNGALLDNNIGASQTTYTDFGPPIGASVTYKVRAVDQDGNVGPFSNQITVHT